MNRRFILISFPILLILAIYFLGASPSKPTWDSMMPAVPSEPDQLEAYITHQESLHNVKPDNEARIIWNDSTRQKTKYSVVYIHGFSASQGEGDPIHTNFAKEFGCNLYLARLSDHGIDTTEQLLYFTADRLWRSSKEALAIGKAIGENVILMSTSTGGTVALMLAAEYPDDVFALINMSPNTGLRNPASVLLNDPWGLTIARMVYSGKYQISDDYNEERKIYWNAKYRLESLTELQEVVEDKMNNETFKKIHQPSLTMYYFKDEDNQDPLLSVSLILKMNENLATPDDQKFAVAIPNAGAHVIGSRMTSKDLESVQREAEKFALETLHMPKVNR